MADNWETQLKDAASKETYRRGKSLFSAGAVVSCVARENGGVDCVVLDKDNQIKKLTLPKAGKIRPRKGSEPPFTAFEVAALIHYHSFQPPPRAARRPRGRRRQEKTRRRAQACADREARRRGRGREPGHVAAPLRQGHAQHPQHLGTPGAERQDRARRQKLHRQLREAAATALRGGSLRAEDGLLQLPGETDHPFPDPVRRARRQRLQHEVRAHGGVLPLPGRLRGLPLPRRARQCPWRAGRAGRGPRREGWRHPGRPRVGHPRRATAPGQPPPGGRQVRPLGRGRLRLLVGARLRRRAVDEDLPAQRPPGVAQGQAVPRQPQVQAARGGGGQRRPQTPPPPGAAPAAPEPQEHPGAGAVHGLRRGGARRQRRGLPARRPLAYQRPRRRTGAAPKRGARRLPARPGRRATSTASPTRRPSGSSWSASCPPGPPRGARSTSPRSWPPAPPTARRPWPSPAPTPPPWATASSWTTGYPPQAAPRLSWREAVKLIKENRRHGFSADGALLRIPRAAGGLPQRHDRRRPARQTGGQDPRPQSRLPLLDAAGRGDARGHAAGMGGAQSLHQPQRPAPGTDGARGPALRRGAARLPEGGRPLDRRHDRPRLQRHPR